MIESYQQYLNSTKMIAEWKESQSRRRAELLAMGRTSAEVDLVLEPEGAFYDQIQREIEEYATKTIRSILAPLTPEARTEVMSDTDMCHWCGEFVPVGCHCMNDE